MGSLIVGTGFVAGEVELEDLWLVGDTGAGNDYVIETKDTTWSINHVFTQGGDLGCVLLQGSLHRLSDMTLNLTDDIGMLVTGDNNQVDEIYIASPGGEAIHFTSAAADNLFSNIQIATAWNGAGTGPAILIDGDDNTLTQIRVRSNAGAMYAIEVGATGDANTIGVVHLDTGATGIINDLGTNTVIYSDSSHAHTGGGDGAAVDHGGLGGLADIADHAYAALIDGTRDITGTQRFTGLTAVLLGGAADAQLQFREDGDSWRLEIGDNADAFVTRMRFFTSDHATQAHDVELRDGDGVTNRLFWDNSLALFRVNATVRPETDSAFDLGLIGGAWRDLFIDKLKNVAGATVYNVETSTFGETQRFEGATIPIVLGATGDSQLEFVEGTDIWTVLTGSNADVFASVIAFFTSDHATQASDIKFFNSAGGQSLLWDNSLNTWRMFTDFRVRNTFPEADVTYSLGSAAGQTWLDLFVDNIKDRAGAVTYDVQTATFPTAHIFSSSVEIDGDLNHDGTNIGFYGTAPTPVSAAYTPTNVTPDRAYDANSTGIDELADVLGTLIADLQLTGIIG